MTVTDDSKLIELFFERSEQAVELLSEKYGGVCLSTARNILSSPQDAEECVNDAYLAVWNTVPPERPSPLIAYLLRIVRNLSLKKHRSNSAAKRGSGYDSAMDELAECIPSNENVESEYDANELGGLIDRFLGTLGKDERVMFVRRYWFGDDIGALAKHFGISRHAASGRLYRTREKLKAYLKKAGETV